MKSIKLIEAVKIMKPEYIYLKLKPNNSIKNNSTHKLARSITSLYKNILESIERSEEKLIKVLGKEYIVPTKLVFKTSSKVSYFIYMEQKKIEFYFIVPADHLLYIKEKISDVWTNLTIEVVEELPQFNDGTKYQLTYKKEDGLSLAVDRRNNDLLHSNLNVVESMKEGDRLGIFYNFMPTNQTGWKFKHKTTVDKAKNGRAVDKDKSGASYVFKMGISLIDDIISTILSAFVDPKKEAEFSILDLFHAKQQVTLSPGTTKKGSALITASQIVVMGASADPIRERNITRSLAQSFDTISEDNQLVYKPFKKPFGYNDYSTGSQRICIGDEEAQNFIALAGRDILEQYNFIERVDTTETTIPDDLQSGVMCIGESTYKGAQTKAYLSDDREYRNLLLLLIGPSRAGKSNLIANLCIDAIENGECAIIFDFIENCELSDSISQLFPPDKVLEIQCDDYAKMQGLGFNEVGVSSDVFKQYENAKRQTSNMLALVNSINADDSRLSPKMERYMESASLAVFISSGSIKDVFAVLQNHTQRARFLSMIPKSQYENLAEYMESLAELDETDKEGAVVGTKSHLIVGIIDRLNILKRNTYMELMLKKDTTDNIDLSTEMQKNQLIVIKMPQHMFTTDGEKDICTTYWITKIWLALQIRADRIRDKKERTKVNLIIDELYQVAYTEQFLTSKLSQIAKFIMKPIISCHYINQLKYMRDELRSANTSYMLLAGCDKKNYDELKNEMHPFTDEDLKNLKRYHSMNYIKNKDGYVRLITKLPPDVKKRISLN